MYKYKHEITMTCSLWLDHKSLQSSDIVLVNNFNGNSHSCMLGHLHVIISISHYNLLTLLSNSFIIQSKQNRSDEGIHHGAVNEPGSHRLCGLVAGRQTGQQNFLHSLNYLEFYFIFYYHSSCYSVINVLQLFWSKANFTVCLEVQKIQ